VRRLEVDTRRFRGNAPQSCRVEASVDGSTWVDVLGEVRLQPDQVHVLAVPHVVTARWLRLVVHPDGGVARLHAWGSLTPAGRRDLGLRWLNALAPVDARDLLLTACGSTRWAQRMADARPLGQDWADVARSTWDALAPQDWEQALAAHPRIGDRPAEGSQERREQASAEAAPSAVLDQIALGNAAYEQRFGRTYVVRAAGRSAQDMLALLEERLDNDPEHELRVAAAQQAEIALLRLGLVVEGP
jgi:OHCU decarboxylase